MKWGCSVALKYVAFTVLELSHTGVYGHGLQAGDGDLFGNGDRYSAKDERGWDWAW